MVSVKPIKTPFIMTTFNIKTEINPVKVFKRPVIHHGNEVFPSVIVTIVNHWDGQRSIKRAYINYLVLGLNYDQQHSYDFIIAWADGLMEDAEEYARNNSDVIYHQ